MLGILLIAILVAGAASGVLYLYGFSIWLVLLAYPSGGAVVLVLGLVLAGLRPRIPPSGSAGHLPVARSTTPTVASSILKSVPNDKLRS